MKIIVKISGDLVENDDALNFIRNILSREKAGAVVICGAGKQISQRQKEKGYKIMFEDGHRIHQSPESHYLASSTMFDLKEKLKKELECQVEVPYLRAGWVGCHVNADDYLRLLAPNFDEVYCLTLKGRTKNFPDSIKVIEFAGETHSVTAKVPK